MSKNDIQTQKGHIKDFEIVQTHYVAFAVVLEKILKNPLIFMHLWKWCNPG